MACEKVVVILGPTCTGKTSLAIKLCKEFNGEIVSADSRQIFKHLDIGTGKLPSDPNLKIIKGEGFWEIDNVKIRCYDIALPLANFTVADYARIAKEEIESITRRGKTAFLVGGTGFYIDVLLGRSPISGVLPNAEFRDSLKNIPASQLFLKLKSLDPAIAENIDKNNPVRLIRALEILLTKNSPTKNRYQPLSCSALFVGLTAARTVLFNNADTFVEDLEKRGILREIKLLIAQGYKDSRPLNGLIYDHFIKLYYNQITRDEALTRTKFDMHAYIRRQLTWFNRNTEVTWFNRKETNLCDKVQSHIQSYLYGE